MCLYFYVVACFCSCFCSCSKSLLLFLNFCKAVPILPIIPPTTSLNSGSGFCCNRFVLHGLLIPSAKKSLKKSHALISITSATVPSLFNLSIL